MRFLVLFLLVSIGAAANTVRVDSFITLPVAKRVNLTGTTTLRSRDLARINYLRGRAAHPPTAEAKREPIKSAGLHSHYTAAVGIGSPPTTYNLIVDTGSGNTWVGASQAYVKTSTRSLFTLLIHGTHSHLNIRSRLGPVDLSACFALLKYCSSVMIDSKSILDSSATDTLSTDNSAVPTVTDNAFSQGLLSSNQIGISFKPVDENGEFNGEITWGKFILQSTYARCETAFDLHYGFEQTITYGNRTIMFPTTGTTLMWVKSDTFSFYADVTGGVLANLQLGLLQITPEQFDNLQSMFITINGVTYEFTPNAQVWPRQLNSVIGGQPDVLYLVVSNLPEPEGFINVFLERFYSVWDNTNRQMGFANTPWTLA
ncbi:acid protease [Mycena pura]|uniref:Acid protease n=1 Tax=Mycena pura TaxID=153505 RepID=A0AAD6Y8K6_9AGAR|nr:acid protease [Mycena pura]